MSNTPLVKFCKTDESAVIPSKAHASDVGYDLTIVKKVKDISLTTAMYDTCVKVRPEDGFYCRIYPRSSIYKYGYTLSNGTGIIDPNFRGSLKIVLTKIDPNMPNFELPFRCAQLIFDKVCHLETEEVGDIDVETDRGDGGFGSTG